ncbi:MAG: sigma-54 dependent transcriptional regulator [Myxococcales bacterium]|nr:sigma-54 dependent transcriptional regulator [Myxococcales bacterium]
MVVSISAAAKGALPPDDSPVIASQAMLRIFANVDQVAPSVVPVLILGETGTGKEIIARSIHGRSGRRVKPFRCLNCGGLAETLIEATFFGHERGAFTGATDRKSGVFEAAHQGTVFLDEVGELPPSGQAALLRVLETKSITRLGGIDEISVDVRIVAATHRDLEAMCATGQFRWDLYYRLNVVGISLPPLRERPEEIAPLAKRFVQAAAQVNQRSVSGISAQAIEHLVGYTWPGNVRELKNVVERAVVIARGVQVEVADLPANFQRAPCLREVPPVPDGTVTIPGPNLGVGDADGVICGEVTEDLGRVGPVLDYKTQMQQAERRVLLAALCRAELNQTEAAKLLQMPLRTLVHKISALGLRDELSRLKVERRRT